MVLQQAFVAHLEAGGTDGASKGVSTEKQRFLLCFLAVL